MTTWKTSQSFANTSESIEKDRERDFENFTLLRQDIKDIKDRLEQTVN